jgi:DNA-binding Xre family transcriptional regulator
MKVISKARQVRLDYQSRTGHPVSLSEVAEKADVDRMALTRLERRARLNRVDMEMIAKLCAFYGVAIGDILEYSPEDIRTPTPAQALNLAR